MERLKSGIDAKTLFESEEYRAALSDLPLEGSLKGLEIELYGDIREIKYGRFGRVTIVCTIIDHSVLGEFENAVVVVPKDKVKELFSMHPLVDTQIRLKVKILDFVMNHYELMDVLELNKDLLYPYNVCSKNNKDPDSLSELCGTVFKFDRESWNDGVCPLCGSGMKKVYNLYSEGLAENIYDDQ